MFIPKVGQVLTKQQKNGAMENTYFLWKYPVLLETRILKVFLGVFSKNLCILQRETVRRLWEESLIVILIHEWCFL